MPPSKPKPGANPLLELGSRASYCPVMKPILLLTIALALGTASIAHCQDAATEERLNKLSGQIEDLIAAQKAQQQQITELSKEIESLREQSVRPNVSYASQEDLKRLAEAVKEIDRKRADD